MWIAVFIALVLGTTAALHLYWALGGLWPGRSAADLESRVIGSRTGRMPPPLLTIGVALAIGLAGLWPLMYLGQVASPLPRGLVVAGMWVLAGIFLLRGLVAYVPGLWQGGQDLPFYRLNRRWFSPLILAIGAGFSWLLLG